MNKIFKMAFSIYQNLLIIFLTSRSTYFQKILKGESFMINLEVNLKNDGVTFRPCGDCVDVLFDIHESGEPISIDQEEFIQCKPIHVDKVRHNLEQKFGISIPLKTIQDIQEYLSNRRMPIAQ
jgi:hypothetical protein